MTEISDSVPNTDGFQVMAYKQALRSQPSHAGAKEQVCNLRDDDFPVEK